MGAKPYIIELDQVGKFTLTKNHCPLSQPLIPLSFLDDGAAIQDALEEMTSQRSVPNIFIAKKHIGGNSDLQAKKSELPELLKDAGAL